MLTQWGYSKRHLYGGNRNSGIWMVGNTLRLYERSAPGVLFNDMNACNNYIVGLERAHQVQCKTVMILGEEDRLSLTPTWSFCQEPGTPSWLKNPMRCSMPYARCCKEPSG